jgi:hypothetical protein
VKTASAGDCTASGSIVGSAAGSPGTAKETVLTCKNASVFVAGVEWPLCTVHSPAQPIGTIVSSKLEGKLAWLSEKGDSEVGHTFNPEVNPSGPIFTLEFTDAPKHECGISTVNVTGSMVARVERITEDAIERNFVFPETAIHNVWTNTTPRTKVTKTEDNLQIGGNASVLKGAFNFSLTSKELWGVEPG